MGLIRLFFYGILFYFLYKLVKGFKQITKPGGSRQSGGTGGTVKAGDLVQDPQCGVYIPVDGSLKGPGGTRFCSEACRDAYRKKGA